MGIRPCAACGREIPDLAEVCPCGHPTSDSVRGAFADPAQEPEPGSTGSPESAAQAAADPSDSGPVLTPSPALTPRDMFLAALAVAAGAVITFALLSSGSVPASDATAAERTATEPLEVEAEAPSTVTRIWSAANRATWVGTRRGAAAWEVEADDTVGIWMRTVRPVLVVRCEGGRTEVFVFTQTAAQIEPQTDDHTVTLGLDDEDLVIERWEDSADHDALFAPRGSAFARRLTEARTLRFGFTPHNAPPATATFQVSGLDRVLATSARECGWKQ
jgi:hypothetical protein